MRVQRLASHFANAAPPRTLLRQGQASKGRTSQPRASFSSMWTLSQQELQEYLQRIDAVKRRPEELPPALQTLNALQFSHVTHIPFENLSLHHPKVSLVQLASGSCSCILVNLEC